MQGTLDIHHADDIRALADRLNLWRADARQLRVELPQLDEEANRHLHRRIAVHYATCGCHQGRLAGIAILGVYLLLFVSGVLSFQAMGIWRVIGLYLLLSFCGLLLTKIALLERSRRALRGMAGELDPGSRNQDN